MSKMGKNGLRGRGDDRRGTRVRVVGLAAQDSEGKNSFEKLCMSFSFWIYYFKFLICLDAEAPRGGVERNLLALPTLDIEPYLTRGGQVSPELPPVIVQKLGRIKRLGPAAARLL